MNEDVVEAEGLSKDILVTQAFKVAWDAFYEWEPNYSRTAIYSLESSNVLNAEEYYDFDFTPLDELDDATQEEDYFEVIDYDFESNTVSLPKRISASCISAITDPKIATVSQPLNLYPYESCTPTSRSLFLGDDPPVMPFIPLADAQGFKFNEVLIHYKAFAWARLRDPDCELLSLLFQCIALLTVWHKYSGLDIIGCGTKTFNDIWIARKDFTCR